MYAINIKVLPKIEVLNIELMRVFRLTKKKTISLVLANVDNQLFFPFFI